MKKKKAKSYKKSRKLTKKRFYKKNKNKFSNRKKYKNKYSKRKKYNKYKKQKILKGGVNITNLNKGINILKPEFYSFNPKTWDNIEEALNKTTPSSTLHNDTLCKIYTIEEYNEIPNVYKFYDEDVNSGRKKIAEIVGYIPHINIKHGKIKASTPKTRVKMPVFPSTDIEPSNSKMNFIGDNTHIFMDHSQSKRQGDQLFHLVSIFGILDVFQAKDYGPFVSKNVLFYAEILNALESGIYKRGDLIGVTKETEEGYECFVVNKDNLESTEVYELPKTTTDGQETIRKIDDNEALDIIEKLINETDGTTPSSHVSTLVEPLSMTKYEPEPEPEVVTEALSLSRESSSESIYDDGDLGDLPPGWIVILPDSGGKIYYKNEQTGEIQSDFPTPPATPFQLPDGWRTKRATGSGEIYYVNELTEETQWERPTAPASPLPDDWIFDHDSSDRIYYVNEHTGETQWERPKEADRDVVDLPLSSVSGIEDSSESTSPSQQPHPQQEQGPQTQPRQRSTLSEEDMDALE